MSMISELVKELRWIAEHEYQSRNSECVIRSAADAIEMLSEKAKEPKQEWIPCSERLPEDPNPSFTFANKTYQVTTASGKVVALKWQKTEVRGKTVMRWEWCRGGIYHGDVLAWKPLSEPWEGADDE